MSEWKKSRRIVAIILVGYFALGILSRATGEIFPIFSWFLFARVPQTQEHYSVFLLQADGANISEPVLFQNAHGVIPAPNDKTAAALIERIGRALEAKPHESEGFRQILEAKYMPRVRRYSVVKISYRPLEYYRTKAHDRKELATFEVMK